MNETEAQYRLLFEKNPNPMWVFDRETLAFLAVNEAAISHYGYSRSEFLGMTPKDIRPPEDIPVLLGYLEKKAAQSVASEIDAAGSWRHRKKDGTLIDVEITWAAVPFADRPAGLVSVRDVTEAKRAQQMLVELERTLAHIMKSVPLVLYRARSAENFATLWASENVEAVSGFPARRFVEEPGFWASRLHPEDFARVFEEFATLVLADEGHLVTEYRWQCADDGYHWFLDQAVIQRDETGRPIQILGIWQDITVRRLAEEALRESEERFRLLVDGVTDYAIFMLNPQGDVISWNAGAERIYGYRAEEIVGRHFSCLSQVEGDMAGTSDRVLQAAAASGRWKDEGWQIRKGGSRFLGHVILTSVRDENGHLRGFARITRDVTEQRQLERQLHQMQKMEAIGRLTAGVAHDFNTVLSVIMAHTHLLLQQLSDPDPRRREAHAIEKAAESAAALIRQLLACGRRQISSPTLLDLNDLVRSQAGLLERLMRENIQLHLNLAPRVGTLKFDPGQLEQIVLNLVINARDAMPQGGTLTLETVGLELNEARPEHAGIPSGSYALLVVHDTGVGMSPEVLPHIFDPFYTTKARGEGTGLGLSTVYGIVTQSGGYIRVDSEPGRGTTMNVYLPKAKEPLDLPRSHQHDIGPLRGSETILLVENHRPLREPLVETLRSLGYTVLEAEHGEEALHRAREHGNPIKLLVTDIMLSTMSGFELADRMRAGNPALPVVYMSGYPLDGVAQHRVQTQQSHFLQKPFPLDALWLTVRKVLGTCGENPSG